MHARQCSSGVTNHTSGSLHHPRHLLIISRYYPGLYDYLRARFAAEGNVEVILDRRRGRDRRMTADGTSVDRRTGERRRRPHIDTALQMESMQFVTIPPGAASAMSPPSQAEPTAEGSP
jgi:hypothetical protein